MQLSRYLLALAFLGSCATPPRPPGQVGVGDTIEVQLPDLQGRQVSLNDLRGKVVMLDLWATWCEPCKVSLPFYASLFQQHESEGFAVVAVSVDLHDDEVQDFMEAQRLPFIVLRDPDGTVPQKIGISALPTMLLLGRDGKVTFVHPGFLPADKEKIASAVQEALKVTITSTVP